MLRGEAEMVARTLKTSLKADGLGGARNYGIVAYNDKKMVLNMRLTSYLQASNL